MTPRFLEFLAVAAVIIAVSATGSRAADFHVDPSHPAADDAGPGTREAPFATLGRGAQEAGPNVTVHVAPGTYPESVLLAKGGAPGEPFTIQADAPGSVIVEAGTAVLFGSTADASGFPAQHVTLRGIVFRNATSAPGKAAVMPAFGWIVEKCRIESCAAGILLDGAIGNVNNVTIADTVVENCPSGGIAGKGDIPSGKPGPDNLTVRDSVVRRCQTAGNAQGVSAAGIYLSGASGATIEGCVLYDNAGPGIWIDHLSERFAITGNTIFANHGSHWWIGAGIQISHSGGPSAPADSVVQNNVLYSNTGPAIALCESHDITVSDNTMIDNGTCVSFRNIYLWNEDRNTFSIANDNKLRNLAITGNRFKHWRRAAIASWERSLLRLNDLQNRGIAISGNQYDAKNAGDIIFALLDDLPDSPSGLAPVIAKSLADLQSKTNFGNGSSEAAIANPKGVAPFPDTTEGLAPQSGTAGEQLSQRSLLDGASMNSTIVLPLQHALTLADGGSGFEGSLFDLRDHVALRVVAPDQAAADALNAHISGAAMWVPVFVKVKVIDLAPYARTVRFDPAAGSGVRDNLIVASSSTSPAMEDGPVAGGVGFLRHGAGSDALTAGFSLAGSAQAGVDYVDPGTARPMAAGISTTEVLVTPIPNDDVDGERTAQVNVVDGTGYYAGSPQGATILVQDKAFDQWRGRKFGYTGPPPAGAGFSDNPDNDPYVNGVEFALGGDPLNPDAALSIAGTSESGHLTLTYQRPANLGGIAITPRISSDLTAWNSGEVEVLDSTDHGDHLTVTVQDTFPMSAHPSRFLQIVVDE